jgi:hypothetical protein
MTRSTVLLAAALAVGVIGCAEFNRAMAEQRAERRAEKQRARDAREKQRQAEVEKRRKAQDERRRREARLKTISITGAVMAPYMIDGTEWDGPGKAGPEAAKAYATALMSSNPYGAVMGVLASPTLSMMAKPDTSGSVELWVGGRRIQTIALDKKQDTFTPQWSHVTFQRVDIESARVRIILIDRDAFQDDPAGVVELGPPHFHTAVKVGTVYPADVHTQSSRQILFVNISVM